MSSSNPALKCPKLVISSWLLVILRSPLSHPPSYLVKCWAGCSESDQAGYSPRNQVRNTESYVGGYPASFWAGHPPENPASSREDRVDSNSARYSADCPDNRGERNPESNWEDNGADYSESCSVSSLPDCLASYPESFDSRPACRAAAAIWLLQLDDLPDCLWLEACGLGLFPHEVHARRQPPHVIRAGMEVEHFPPADVQ